jgi:hypothetical protein
MIQFSPWPGLAVRRAASLALAYARPSTPFLPNCSKDADARHRRQVYAVCAKQTATAGHDDARKKSHSVGLLIEPGSQSVHWRCCRICPCTAAAAVKVGTGLLTTL